MKDSKRQVVQQAITEARAEELPATGHPCFTGSLRTVTCKCGQVFQSKVVYSMARRQAITDLSCPGCGKRDASTKSEA